LAILIDIDSKDEVELLIIEIPKIMIIILFIGGLPLKWRGPQQI